jgi:hypothetical protein
VIFWFNRLEEEEEREKESETGSIADDISINIGSIQSSCEDIESELDDELIRRQGE